jgi:ABC-2 type transport system permease protein
MKGMLAIYRRELGNYFVSPVAYIVVGLFLLITGYLFYSILSFLMQQQIASQMQRMGPQAMDVPGQAIRAFFDNMSFILLFLLPMLTMGIYADERKRGTMELLMTSPVTEFQIVMAKFLAVLSLFAAMLAPTLLYLLYMSVYSEPGLPWKIILTGYLGVLLLGAVLLAIGSFISSLTESQIIAAVATFAAFLLLWVIDFGVRNSTSTMGEFLQYLSILRHFDDFPKGVIDTTGVIFYLSFAGLGFFLTLRTIDSMRWRRA